MNARSGTAKILVVDDHPEDREVLVRSFAERRFEPTLASNVDEAMSRLEEQRFDAVLSDLDTARVNGFELLRAIHLRHPGVPVILMTTMFDEAL